MNKFKEILSKLPKLSKTNRKSIIRFSGFIFAILIITFIISTVINSNKLKNCNSLLSKIISYTDEYMGENNLLPTLNGTAKEINLNELDENIIFKDKVVTGSVIYTKYNDEYIKTVNIKNANYCDTKEFSKASDKYNKDKNVKVDVTFNYYTVDKYNSKWTDWLPSEDISKEETNGVFLPVDSKKLPTIPENANITEYVRETKTYYSYRDKRWKWYKNNIPYSNYSSTQPSGYTYKDSATESATEYTEWSLDYPTVYDYRNIRSTTGYRWYTTVNKEKVYFENGKYLSESPGNEYKKDNDSKVTMYSYSDKIWRWYNGETKRLYSSYSSTLPYNYNYKDESTLDYSNWTPFKDTSSLDNSNKEYREERTDIYSRYLIRYDIYSYAILEKNVTLEELESKLGKSYNELLKDESIRINVYFKFYYE